MRNIFIVNARQTVVSEAHPEGLNTIVDGYPKPFDSVKYPALDGNPNGDSDAALNAAKADYYTRLGAFYSGSANRVQCAITLETANGRQILCDSIGSLPDMTPTTTGVIDE